jgi:hypothetical protein
MNGRPKQESLLDDVLAEAAPADFRATLLADTLREVGSRRRSKQIRRGVAVAAGLALGAFLSWRGLSLSATGSSIAGCEIVRTQPLADSAVVRTQIFAMEISTGSQPAVVVIETPAERPGFRIVNDDELLALASPRTVALVRLSPDSQALIFLPLPEAEAPPVN